MKAVNTTGRPPGGDRVILADSLPLDTPLVVQIFPIYACNLSCRFCHFAIPKDKRDFVTTYVTMSMDTLINAVDGMAWFPRKTRVLRWVGMGEPLLNTNLSDMIAYATEKKVAERTEVLTNGLLLTPTTSKRLVRSGLSRLVISIQGTSGEKYKDIAGKEIDFEAFLDQIRYFYSIKNWCHVHIKVIDCSLDGHEDEERFFDLFGDMCDTIAIENAGPIYPNVPMNKELAVGHTTQYGAKASEVKTCPQPFATLQVNPDGEVVPCYSLDYPCFVGNVNTEMLFDIWNGDTMKMFRLNMLEGRAVASDACANCKIISHRMSAEDSLDGHENRLRRLYE